MTSAGGPLFSFLETWDALDASSWTDTDPATGTAWAVSTNSAWKCVTADPNASENARIVSVQTYAASPYRFANTGVQHGTARKFVMEWEMRTEAVLPSTYAALLDATAFFVGLSASNSATRATTNIIGFGVNYPGAGTSAWAATAVDDGGTDTATAHTGIDIQDWHTYRIELFCWGTGQRVNLYIDDVCVGKLTLASIEQVFYLNFYTATTSSGPAQLRIGELRVYYDNVDDYNTQENILQYRLKEDQDYWVPMRLTSSLDRRQNIVGKPYDELVVKYTMSSASSWYTYTVTSTDWVEYGEGWYKLWIGGSEFISGNEHVILSIADNRRSASTANIVVSVNDYTVDEVYDEIYSLTGGSGDTNNYNVYNSMVDNTQRFNKVDKNIDSVRNLVVKTKNKATQTQELAPLLKPILIELETLTREVRDLKRKVS